MKAKKINQATLNKKAISILRILLWIIFFALAGLGIGLAIRNAFSFGQLLL